MARVLVLRHGDQAAETAALLRARGHEPLLLPVQRIEPLDGPPPSGAFSGFAVTSRNAVATLARHFPGDPRPVLAVGSATALALSAWGFGNVIAGEGGGAGLAQAALRCGASEARPLLLAVGRVRNPDLETGLRAAAIPFVVWETYDTLPLRPDAGAIATALDGRRPDAALLLSATQADGYLDLVRDARHLFTPSPEIFCLSERIAARLSPELRAKARVSQDRNAAALFERLI